MIGGSKNWFFKGKNLKSLFSHLLLLTKWLQKASFVTKLQEEDREIETMQGVERKEVNKPTATYKLHHLIPSSQSSSLVRTRSTPCRAFLKKECHIHSVFLYICINMAAVVPLRLACLSAIISILIAPAIARPDFFRYSCSDKEGNYSSGSSFNGNLNHLLSSLASNSTEIDKGFYNSSYGENPNKVYAIALCRGDIKPHVCLDCFNISKDILPTQLCPNKKEAIVWYDECMLRYSSRNIFSTMDDTSPHDVIYYNTANVPDDGKVDFRDQLSGLFRTLIDQAAAGGSLRKFATGNAATQRFHTIQALVQCTPDLSDQDCKYCLNSAFRNFFECCADKLGGRILRPSCSFRYEIYRFYDPTSDEPPPVKGSDITRTAIIIIGLPIVAFVLAIIIAIYICLICPLCAESGWDVFLSFRGPDTRKTFTDHLYSALKQARIHTFLDDELPKGETISTELLNTIQKSRMSIVIFSEGYAFSSWCLDELAKIVDCRQTIGHILLPIFYHVNPSDVRHQTGTFAEAFDKHQVRFQTDLERVQRWRDALNEAGNSSGFHLDNIENRYESKFIKQIVNKVLELKATKRRKSKKN